MLFPTLCDPNIFRTVTYSEPKAYSEYCQTSISNILFKTLCNPDIFRNLAYSELWYILKSKDIQNPAE